MSWGLFTGVVLVVGLGVLAATAVLLHSASLTSREDDEDEASWEAWRAAQQARRGPGRSIWEDDDDAA